MDMSRRPFLLRSQNSLSCFGRLPRGGRGSARGRVASRSTEGLRLQLVAESQCLQLGDGIVLGPEIDRSTGDAEGLSQRCHAAISGHSLLSGNPGFCGHGADAKYTFHCCQVNFA